MNFGSFMLGFLFIFSFVVSMVILILPKTIFFSKKEKGQVEAGFSTLSKTSLKSFSVNFFFILCLFIIFDLEVVVVFSLLMKTFSFLLLFIVFFVLFTLWLEWGMNKILWKS